MLTLERVDVLNEFMAENPERARKLLDMEPEAALVEINSAGHDFILEELLEYCEAFKMAVAKDELGEDDLTAVTGGSVVITTAVVLKVGGGLLAAFGVGTAIGVAAGAKW